MMFAPPPSLPDSEPGAGGANGGMGQQPPRSSSASSLNTTGLPPAFPPPPPPPATTEGVTPPPNLQQQQQQSSQINGPAFQGQKSPAVGSNSSPGGGTSFQFPPPTLTSPFDPSAGSGGRAPTPRLQQTNTSGGGHQQITDGRAP